MHDPHIDLLPYADIEAEVDRLYRAYLDASLIERAKQYKDDPRGYWKQVLDLLKSEFGIDEKAAHKDPTEKEALLDLFTKTSGAQPLSRYLYWFDVRADYWSPPFGNSAWSAAVEALPSKQQLKSLFDQAAALKLRIDEQERQGFSPPEGADTLAPTKGSTAEGPPTLAQLKAILAKLEASKPAHSHENKADRSKE